MTGTLRSLVVFGLLAALPALADGPGWEKAHQAGLAHYQAGRLPQAEQAFRRALGEAEGFPAKDPRPASTWHNLGAVLKAEGKLDEAEAAFQRALRIARASAGRGQVAQTLRSLAVLRLQEGKPADAVPLLEEALALRRKGKKVDTDLAGVLNDLATAQAALGRHADAARLYGETVEVLEKAVGPDHALVAVTLLNLASAQAAAGETGPAADALARALAVQRKTAPGDPATLRTARELASARQQLGELEAAEAILRETIGGLEARDPGEAELAETLTQLGVLLHQENKEAEAQQVFERALALQEKAFGPESPEVALALSNLGAVYRDQEKWEPAEAAFLRALAILEKAPGRHAGPRADLLEHLALLLERTKRKEEAGARLEEARRLRTTAGFDPAP